MEFNANMEKHWKAIILYIAGLIALARLHASEFDDFEDDAFPDLTLDGILQELALQRLEEAALQALPEGMPCYVYRRRVVGWGAQPGQVPRFSRWKAWDRAIRALGPEPWFSSDTTPVPLLAAASAAAFPAAPAPVWDSS